MGVTNSNKELSVSQINCNDTFNIRLSLSAVPDIVSNPTDIVLILDRSGSMSGNPLISLKNGAKKFIDIIDESTDGTQDGQIGSGSRIGIVSFADTATQNTQLITSVDDLKQAIDSLSAGGATNHYDAFTKALALFDPSSTNAKVMIMFTDGVTTAGGNANTIATLAKSQGVIIYCIGLSGNGGLDEQALRDWASDPDSAYVSIAPSDSDLENLFENLAKNISKPGATNIVITDKVKDCFKVLSISSPSKGSASIIDNTTIQWKIDELGTTSSEGATLEFTLQHLGTCSGEIEVNESITFTDSECNVVSFPNPTLTIDCGTVAITEPCPEPIEFALEGCKDTIELDAGEIEMESLGRIVQLDVKIKNICPNKRVALAILLNEVDEEGNEYKRGMKTMVIPAHTRQTCQDITIKGIKFVLPESLDVIDQDNKMCNTRNLKARFITNYIDNDFTCCNED